MFNLNREQESSTTSSQTTIIHNYGSSDSTLEQKNDLDETEKQILEQPSSENNSADISSSSTSLDNTTTSPTTSFVCKQCRTPLFTNGNISPHTQGGGQTSFGWRKRMYVALNRYLLVDLELMPGSIAALIFWTKCLGCFLKTRLPSRTPKMKANCFVQNVIQESGHGIGLVCSVLVGMIEEVVIMCSAWCAPAFQISKAKIDEKMTSKT